MSLSSCARRRAVGTLLGSAVSSAGSDAGQAGMRGVLRGRTCCPASSGTVCPGLTPRVLHPPTPIPTGGFLPSSQSPSLNACSFHPKTTPGCDWESVVPTAQPKPPPRCGFSPFLSLQLRTPCPSHPLRTPCPSLPLRTSSWSIAGSSQPPHRYTQPLQTFSQVPNGDVMLQPGPGHRLPRASTRGPGAFSPGISGAPTHFSFQPQDPQRAPMTLSPARSRVN